MTTDSLVNAKKNYFLIIGVNASDCWFHGSFLNRVGNYPFYLATEILDVVVGLNVDDFGFLSLLAIRLIFRI